MKKHESDNDNVRSDVRRDKEARVVDGWAEQCQEIRKKIAKSSYWDGEGRDWFSPQELAVLLEACVTYVVTSDLSLREDWQDDVDYWRRAIVRHGGEVDPLVSCIAEVLLRARCRPVTLTADYRKQRMQQVERLTELLKNRLGLEDH